MIPLANLLRAPRLLIRHERAGPPIALLIIFIVFVFLVPDWTEHQSFWHQINRFANFENISTILRQSSMTAVAAVGVTFIIIAGGIDLSAGSLAAMTGVLIAVTLRSKNPDLPFFLDHTLFWSLAAGAAVIGGRAATAIFFSPEPDKPIAARLQSRSLFWLMAAVAAGGVAWGILFAFAHGNLSDFPILWPLFAAVIAIGVGVLAGSFNGALVTGLKVVPFIITLGTMMIFRGTAKYFANESNVPTNSNWLWELMAPLEDSRKWMIFPPAIWMTLVLAIAMSVVLNFSRFGRQVIAVGSNEQTARLCGIPVARTKLLVYTLGGLFTGIAGLFFYSRITQGSPTSADAFELDVIAAVVIGGASLSGGKGSIFGSLIGALILNVIARGCSQIHIPDYLQQSVPSIFNSSTGLPTYVQQIVTGGIIITAAFIDRLRQRRTSG